MADKERQSDYERRMANARRTARENVAKASTKKTVPVWDGDAAIKRLKKILKGHR